jgi:hypothetical protein
MESESEENPLISLALSCFYSLFGDSGLRVTVRNFPTTRLGGDNDKLTATAIN